MGWQPQVSPTAIKIVFAVCGVLLALTAGLAVTCFAKVFAMGFLGMSRSEGAAHAAEAPAGTLWPMALLAAACIVLGALPTYVIPLLDRTASPFTQASATAALVPPFFSQIDQREENIPPAFIAEFHDLGAQAGSGELPGRGLVVLHRGEERNPVVFAMSTSYMLVVLAIVLASCVPTFDTKPNAHARCCLGRRHTSALARDYLHSDWFLEPSSGRVPDPAASG
jgi:hydrogenase-4 component B